LQDKCGIVGAYSRNKSDKISRKIYYGLYALQHRGQESAGISSHNSQDMNTYRGMGLVCDVFKNSNVEALDGHVGIGHVRYSTTGKSLIENSQPFVSQHKSDSIAVAHNGDIINSPELRTELQEEGYHFFSSTDSEVICHLLTREYDQTGDMIGAIKNVSKLLLGSYSLVILYNDDLMVVRDPIGIKPLSLGKTDDTHLVASETVAFDAIGAEYVRPVNPGEILKINNTVKSYKLPEDTRTPRAHCMFEYVYFARPDSILDGRTVYNVRLNIGKELAREFPVDADVIVPVPDSAITAAIGYSRETGIPYGEGLIKNRYVGRTFIMPTQEERENSVRLKMNPIRSELEGKKIVLLDDSIVRGTTSKALVEVVRDAGVDEIHFRVGCPPIISPCYYGIAMATRKELIAYQKPVEEIRKILGVDSLGYLGMDSLVKCIGIKRGELCMGCITGDYPTELPDDIDEYEACRC
jgi:amidophosphoribosyltransferase